MSNDTTELKTCTKCGIAKPATLEFFFKDSRLKSGLTAACKSCVYATNRKYQKTNPDKVTQQRQKWRNENREHVNAESRKQQLKHRERIAATKKRYVDKNKERVRAKQKEWRENNRKHVSQQALIHVANRRARKESLPNTFTNQEWLACLEYFNHCCAYCGCQKGFWNPIQMEHFIPVTSGGGFTKENIIPACKSCNASKKDKPALKWLIEKYGAHKAKEIIKRVQDYFDSL